MRRPTTAAKDIVEKELEDFRLWVADKVTVVYDGNEDSIEEKDRDYDGMNIVHLAIRFYPKFVVPLLRFLKKNNQGLLNDMINQATAKTQQTPLRLVVDEVVWGKQADTKMQTPVHLAVNKRESNLYSVNNTIILLEYDADLSKKNWKQKLPIHMAESPSILNLLLSSRER